MVQFMLVTPVYVEHILKAICVEMEFEIPEPIPFGAFVMTLSSLKVVLHLPVDQVPAGFEIKMFVDGKLEFKEPT